MTESLDHHLWGFIYSVDPDSGLITARNVFDTAGQRIRTYRRVE